MNAGANVGLDLQLDSHKAAAATAKPESTKQ
jgi:hypothetical protein